MAYDLGDVATLAIQIKDNTGTLANAGAVVATVTAPDGTTSTPSVTNGSTGNYSTTYTATLVGRHSIRWVATGANAGAYTDVFEIADPALLPVVSLSDLKTHLRRTSATDTTDDETLRNVLAVATDMAEQYCNRALRRKTIIETRNAPVYDNGGMGRVPVIALYETPVISVTTVVENGVTLTANDYSVDLNSGLLWRGVGVAAGSYNWFGGQNAVTVTYVAGFTDPPMGVQYGVKEIARWLWQSTQQGPRPAFGQSGDFSGAGDAIPQWLWRPLEPYRSAATFA